jgi:hypothetical protein
MPRIFISYRRSDTRAIAGRLHDRLEMAFGDDNIFKDVDDITPGADFRHVLRAALSDCDVLLVLIGKTWKQDRLFEDNDFVRFEVATALKRDDMTVIPVLVDGAEMPAPDDLPPDLRSLAFRNAVVIRHDPDFRRDVDRLIEQLKRLVTGQISTVRASHSAVQSQVEVKSNIKFSDGVALSGLMMGGILAVIIVAGILLITLILNTRGDDPTDAEIALTDVASGNAPFGWDVGTELFVLEDVGVSTEPFGEPYEPHSIAKGEIVHVIDLNEGGTIGWVVRDGEVWFYIRYSDEEKLFDGWLAWDVLGVEAP